MKVFLFLFRHVFTKLSICDKIGQRGDDVMNFLHLKYLLAVEKYGSISKAASHLYINQPHLSKIIKEIEEEMNIKIFERYNKGVVPTKKGEEFLAQTKKIVQEVVCLENMYKDNSNKIRLYLSVPRATYISKAFTDYLNSSNVLEKEVNIDYRETNTMDTIDKIYNGNSSLGIIRFPVKDVEYYLNVLKMKDLMFEKLFEFEYVVLMSKHNPLYQQVVYAKDLDQQVELIHGDISIPEVAGIGKNKKNINIYERSIQFELLTKLNNCYMWVSPIPYSELVRYDLITKKCEDIHIDYVDYLIYRRGYVLTRDDKNFIEYLKGNIEHNM